jgi:hypothetical protein
METQVKLPEFKSYSLLRDCPDTDDEEVCPTRPATPASGFVLPPVEPVSVVDATINIIAERFEALE